MTLHVTSGKILESVRNEFFHSVRKKLTLALCNIISFISHDTYEVEAFCSFVATHMS